MFTKKNIIRVIKKEVNNLKKIFFVLLCVLPFIYFPKEVHGAEPVTITISGNVATAKLTGKPAAYAVQSKIFDLLINRKYVTKLIVDGEFGEDNASGMAKQLSYTNISELEVKNSNYLPSQFYYAGANKQPGKLTSYKDDGTVKELMWNSLSTNTNYRDPNRLIYFESPSSEKIYSGVFDGFRGEELIVPQIKESVHNTSSNYNNFEQMPNVKKINLSGLEELTGYGLFTEMPNLTSLDLSNVKSLTSMGFLNNNNTSPTYVNLSNLITLNEKDSVGSKTSTNPVYIKLGNSHPEKLFNENTNAIFYKSISPKLNFEVEKGTDIKVSSIGDSSFLSYNTNDCKVIWYIDNALSQYVGTDINVKTNNLSEGVHSLTPVISYKGKQDRGFFGNLTINVNVYKSLTAEPASPTTSLGIDISKLDYSKFVKNVKLRNQVLSSDQYKVELINSFATDTVGTKTAKVRITLKSDTSKTEEVDVPVEVGWGNSVVYGSYDYYLNGRTLAAFTLYTESTPTIVASQGQSDDNLAIDAKFPNKQYYTFTWFKLADRWTLKIDEWNNGDKFIKARGNELKKDKLKEWGTDQNQAVNYGDIVRAWQTETGKNWLYENEQKQAYNDDKESVYYEITTSGYRPLHFNQLTPKTGKIPIYSTNKYLDEHVKDYIDLKGYSNIDAKEFVEYPDTTSSGDKRAKILVEETLTTGKKVQYIYEVTINVEPGTLTSTVPKTLTFKEFSKSKSEQIVQRKYSGSLGLLIKDNRGSNKQGNWTLTAKASSDLKGIAPYLIYRNEKGVDSYLNGSAVPVYTQDKQVSATEPLEVEVSNKWKRTDGILLKVPSKNNLAIQEYSTTITWNLVEGP